MPTHHVPDSMLIAYAAGSLGTAESLLVACHITLCPACRDAVSDAELVGAALLDGGPALPAGLSPGLSGELPAGLPDANLLDRILARLDHEPGEPDIGPATGTDPARVLPAPLYRLVGALDTVAWREVLPGLELAEVAAAGGRDRRRSSLARLAPGARVPMHGHAGSECLVVFTGGYTDDRGHYLRGDVSVRSAGDVHEQRADPGEPCIWLVVSEHAPILVPDAGR